MTQFQVPPFITPGSKFIDEHAARRLSRLAASGDLVRVRRGLYLPAGFWEGLKPWEKYRIRIQAVHELAACRPVFARESAAQIMGLPLIRIPIPGEVQTVIAVGKSGGQSSHGVGRVNAVLGDPPPWEMFGLLVTPPVQTVRDLAVRLPLAQSLPALDKLLQRKILPGSPPNVPLVFTADDVRGSALLLPNGTQRGRVERALEVGNGLSQSAGESLSRAIMIQNGFPTPALQVPLRDSRGLIGLPDFDWEEYKTLGEFDGYEKYSAQKYLNGKTPSQVVVEEKNRENRLRAQGYNVVRWVWDDLRDPRRLVTLLHEAGLRSK
ncbi:MAG: type IV toxin-antitoxin system AbiEi family antitoxin domain-containing protein [Specibacter sp.]